MASATRGTCNLLLALGLRIPITLCAAAALAAPASAAQSGSIATNQGCYLVGQTVKNNPARIREVNREIEQLGATVKAQWATLGHFDFVNVVEAPDEKTIARVSLELGSRGTAKYETLSAIPIDDFIGSI